MRVGAASTRYKKRERGGVKYKGERGLVGGRRSYLTLATLSADRRLGSHALPDISTIYYTPENMAGLD